MYYFVVSRGFDSGLPVCLFHPEHKKGLCSVLRNIVPCRSSEEATLQGLQHSVHGNEGGDQRMFGLGLCQKECNRHNAPGRWESLIFSIAR